MASQLQAAGVQGHRQLAHQFVLACSGRFRRRHARQNHSMRLSRTPLTAVCERKLTLRWVSHLLSWQQVASCCCCALSPVQAASGVGHPQREVAQQRNEQEGDRPVGKQLVEQHACKAGRAGPGKACVQASAPGAAALGRFGTDDEQQLCGSVVGMNPRPHRLPLLSTHQAPHQCCSPAAGWG